MDARIAVLADGHITHDDPERLGALVRTLDELPADVTALYVLGDLFEVWVGVRPQPHVERFAEAVRRLRRRGVRVAYVEGNRDYLVASGGPWSDLFDAASAKRLVDRFGSRCYHFAHGDLLNTADRQYRAWRAFSKHLLAPLAVRALPASGVLALARRLEASMRKTNRKHKSYFPREACERYARQAVRDGADVVVVGHFHRALKFEVEEAGRRGLFISLPFWHQEPRLVLFDAAGAVSGLEPLAA